MTDSPSTNQASRAVFRYVNRFHLWMWRLGLGNWLNAWPKGLGCYMVLTQTGRKSGLKRQTSVNYAEVDGEIYCVSGFGTVADWYRNLKANPQVEIWLPNGWWNGEAEEHISGENRLPIIRAVLVGSAFVARLMGLDPVKMSDAQLADITTDYRLIHIRRTVARTGPGGPGDLAWIWPAFTFVLLFVLMKRRKR